MRRYRLLLGAIALAICLDQVSKAAATATLSEERVLPRSTLGVDLRLRYNPGVGWGLGASLPSGVKQVLFPLFVVLVGAALLLYARRLPPQERGRPAAIGLIIGGGLGNVIDRLRIGAVIDFIGVDVGGAGWTMSGTFNLADLWVVVGLLVLVIRGSARGPREGTESTMAHGEAP